MFNLSAVRWQKLVESMEGISGIKRINNKVYKRSVSIKCGLISAKVN